MTPEGSLANNLLSLTIPISINGQLVWAIMDTGAQTSLISENLIDRVMPNWRKLPESPGPKQGIAANGEIFKFLANRKLNITIGKVTKSACFSIASGSSELLLGLNVLKKFKVRIEFTNDRVEIACNQRLLGVFPLKDMRQLFGTNRVKANADSSGEFEVEFPANTTLLISTATSTSLLPVLINSDQIINNKIRLPWNNDLKLDIQLEEHSQMLLCEVLGPEDLILSNADSPR